MVNCLCTDSLMDLSHQFRTRALTIVEPALGRTTYIIHVHAWTHTHGAG
jgi:hypothetical protein